jgi:hypothetical protein
MNIRRVLALFLVLYLQAAGQTQPPPPEQPRTAPKADDRFKADLLLIVAHPDDETGVSAYLAQLLDQGKRVAAVYLTHGEAGHNNMGRERGPSLGLVREMELRHAMTQLGVQNVWFLEGKDTPTQDVLRELFVEYGPCLILIDEWVAYARQLHDNSDLPAGSFETMFTFAQALTESAKLANNCLLVVSLPASDTGGSPHTQADDVEVGGVRGREALDRLRNVIGRVESSWRPATAEEGFEIVRRRLFEAIPGDQFKNRDLTARAFSELYHVQAAEFPPECRSADYEKRMQAAYPIHPEVFDRLYSDWSTLVKFQRTRGVLRLMAAVIHCLWEKGDKNPLILPSTIPIDDARVQFELTRYLSDAWAPIIERDIDGPNSLPLRIDTEPDTCRLCIVEEHRLDTRSFEFQRYLEELPHGPWALNPCNPAAYHARRLVLGIAVHVGQLLVVRGAGVARLGLEMVLAEVERDLVEPAGELRLLLELRQALVGPDERLLGHILGVVAVAHHRVAQIDDPGAVLVDQLPIQLRLAALALPDDRTVVQPEPPFK